MYVYSIHVFICTHITMYRKKVRCLYKVRCFQNILTVVISVVVLWMI